MSINLIKGQKIDLYKIEPGVKSIAMGFTLYSPINDFFVAAILTGSSGKVEETKNFIFYDNLSNHNSSVLITNDTPPQVNVHLDRVPPAVQKITLALASNTSVKENVPPLTLQLYNLENAKEIAHYKIQESTGERAMVISEIYRYNGNWKFAALGSGLIGGFQALCLNYGVTIKRDNPPARKDKPALINQLARIDTYVKNRQKNEYEKNQMSLGIVDTSIFGR